MSSTEVAHRKFQRKFWGGRTAGSNRQTEQGALLSSGGIKPLCFLSSTTQVKIPSPRTDSMASQTHLLARKRQGSLINSASQAAFLTKMSRGYYAKEITEREKEKKSAPHGVSMHFYQRRREREKQKGAKKNHGHWHTAWIQSRSQKLEYLSHSHLLIIIRKEDFSIAYYWLRRTPHQIWRIFFLSVRMWQDHFVLFLHFIKIKTKRNKEYCWPYAWNKPAVY